MSKVLVIAEKPSVARTIAKTLEVNNIKKGYMEGSGYIVSYAFGHLCEYANPEAYNKDLSKWKRDDLPIIPSDWKMEVSVGKREQFEILKKLLNRTDIEYVVNACDAGREGELIFHFIYEMAKSKLLVKRLWISSMESDAIKEGFISLRDAEDYEGLKQAAIARSKADWLVGINGTRLFTTLYNGTLLKVGRVQSPTLAMIVDRDNEINTFKSEPFYTIKLEADDLVASSDRFYDKEMAEATLTLSKDGEAVVTRVISENKKSNPPKLYDLTSLQRDANRLFGMTAKETLDATQSLYEKKLATYPRTDSRYLTDDMQSTAENVIEIILDVLVKDYKIGYRPDTKKLLNSKKVSDHHAIIPTVELAKCDTDTLSVNERKILYMISYRLLSASAEPCEYILVKAEIVIRDLLFKASGKNITKLGYKEYEDRLKMIFASIVDDKKNDDECMNNPLPNLYEGQVIKDYKTSLSEGKTKPPKRYTEDTLLKAMEKAGTKETDPDAERKGIGTPATRAGIIEKLVHDKYVKREKKNLVSTDLGKRLVKVLPEELKSAELTAEWENDLLLISKGEAYHDEFLGAIEEMVKQLVKNNDKPDYDVLKELSKRRRKSKRDM